MFAKLFPDHLLLKAKPDYPIPEQLSHCVLYLSFPMRQRTILLKPEISYLVHLIFFDSEKVSKHFGVVFTIDGKRNES